MSWETDLQDCVFDNTLLYCKNTKDAFERALAIYEYPHRDGAEVDDLGQRARSIAVTAVVWGANYSQDLESTLKTLGRTGSADFIHPVFGLMKLQVQRFEVAHTEERPDYAEINIQFLEDSKPAVFSAKPTAQQEADAAALAVSTAQDASTAALVAKTPGLASQLRSLRARLNVVDKFAAMTKQLRQNVNDVVLAGLDVLTYPSSWASDIRSIFNAVASAPRAAAARIQGSLAGFKMIRNALWPQTHSSGALAAPVLPIAAVPGTPVAERTDVAPAVVLQALGADLVLRERSLALAGAVGELLGLEADSATLTPAEIASMTAQTRAALQDAIDSARATLPAEDAYAVIEALRNVASALLDAAQTIILTRPPLTTWAAPAAGNLLLIAHWRYGDASRADELARLNPGVARSVFVQQGQTMTGFAQ